MKIMPYWLTTMYWRRQLPITEEVKGSVTMETVKFGKYGDVLVTGNLTLKYCPDWSAPRKKGRPKGNAPKKSSKEIAMIGKRKRNANKKTRSQYCNFCDSFGHTARKCLMRHSQDDEDDSIGNAAI